jgi:hypothetical protein
MSRDQASRPSGTEAYFFSNTLLRTTPLELTPFGLSVPR